MWLGWMYDYVGTMKALLRFRKHGFALCGKQAPVGAAGIQSRGLRVQEEENAIDCDKNAEAFAAGTVNICFRAIQDLFLEYVPQGGRILDFGCGSGRDTKYFLGRGYRVDAVDGSGELCRIVGAYTGIPVEQMKFHELDRVGAHDGIWACASILHVAKRELPDVLRKMADAAKDGGILYASFKYGEFEGVRDGRYFTCFTEEGFRRVAEAKAAVSKNIIMC